ncbi:MAG: hypothetical protein RLZZ203_2445 [Cyanobacteriota bacterium]|jgi:hypothetical protein
MNLKSFDLSQLGEFTSKSKLIQILKISSRTMYEYHQLALLIDDFENDYPSFTGGSQAITSCELTKYQSWVIVSLIFCCQRLKRRNVYECLLKGNNPEFTAKFSKANYQQLNQDLGAATNDITTICKAA